MIISERLRSLREEKGLSQEKLAAELGVTRMTLAGYELAKRAPDSEFILKICNFFDCTPDYVFGISQFKNNEHYMNWISSSETLTVGLSLLQEDKRAEFVTALNWLLQDNYAVNQLTSDKDYLVDKFVGFVIAFTDIFQNFTQTVLNSNSQIGIEENNVLKFLELMESDKAILSKITDTVCSDMFKFLMRNSTHNIKKAEETV